jgi:Family of unknown function (DUF6236)
VKPLGEAKRRKAADPTFGRSIRGLVLSCPIEIDGRQLLVKSVRLDPQELRFALLFWERLVWPISRAVYIESGPDEKFLIEAGVMKRPEYTVSGDVAQGMAISFRQAFVDLNDKEPGVWAMSSGEKSVLIKNAPQILREAGLALDLHRAIPVPNVDVPLNEILEFKARRSNSLLNLRTKLDEFAENVRNEGYSQRTLQLGLDEVDQACAEVLRVANEWQFPVRLASNRIGYDFRPFVTVSGAASAFFAADRLGLPLATDVLAAVAGAAAVTAPALKLTGAFGWRGLRRPRSPFHYVASFHKELF